MISKPEQSNSDKWKNVIYIVISAVTILTFIYQSSASISRAQESIKTQEGKINEICLNSKDQENRVISAEKALASVDLKLAYIADDIQEQKNNTKEILKYLVDLKK